METPRLGSPPREVAEERRSGRVERLLLYLLGRGEGILTLPDTFVSAGHLSAPTPPGVPRTTPPAPGKPAPAAAPPAAQAQPLCGGRRQGRGARRSLQSRQGSGAERGPAERSWCGYSPVTGRAAAACRAAAGGAGGSLPSRLFLRRGSWHLGELPETYGDTPVLTRPSAPISLPPKAESRDGVRSGETDLE